MMNEGGSGTNHGTGDAKKTPGTHNNNNNNNNNNTEEDAPAAAVVAIPWWQSRDDDSPPTIDDDLNAGSAAADTDEDSCGEECLRDGGRCVFDFNLKDAYRQACVHDSVQPCHKFNCVHGECESRNGSYSCGCRAGWTGIFCNKPCSLDCGPRGQCVVMARGGDPACECQRNYTGLHCDQLKPTPSPWTGEREKGFGVCGVGWGWGCVCVVGCCGWGLWVVGVWWGG